MRRWLVGIEPHPKLLSDKIGKSVQAFPKSFVSIPLMMVFISVVDAGTRAQIHLSVSWEPRKLSHGPELMQSIQPAPRIGKKSMVLAGLFLIPTGIRPEMTFKKLSTGHRVAS